MDTTANPFDRARDEPGKGGENNANGQNDRKRKSKRNRAEASSEERVSKRSRQDVERNSTSNRRTRPSTAKERESLLKRSCHEPLNEGQLTKQPKRGSQNFQLTHETSDAADPTPMGEPLSIKHPPLQDSETTAARSVKSRSVRRSAPKKDKISGKDTG